MQSRPEKDKASTAPTVEVLNEVTPTLTKGFNMSDSIQLPGTSIAHHIAVIDGKLTTTTQDIADVYGKQHAKVMAVVRQRMAEAGEWGIANFGDTQYTNRQNGQTYQVIRMTKKGFHFVVGKFTGAKAVQHQIAFADEFERMEQELLKQQPSTQRPYNPAIDYTRISPSQAQDIKELVHQVVDSGVQGFPDTWARLHKKFRVNSYLELPATKYNEVCAYLRGKLPPAPAPAPAPKPAPTPQPSFITKSVFISPTAVAKCIELRDDGSKQGVSFASNLIGEIQFALMFNGSAAHTRLTVSSAREMGNALLEVANAQAALEQRAA